jgi:2-polyprenyl-3-methyl-5-hydroxy-6-metoxy-1,4-benzoquinol methylase
MSISRQEAELYETMWGVPAYSTFSPGATYAPIFLDLTGDRLCFGHKVLDAGCGSGKGALALHAMRDDLDIRLCDLTPEGLVEDARAFPFYRAVLWQSLKGIGPYVHGGKYDWVYCTDVLEHIPTPFTMLVVSRLMEVAREGVFISVSLMPDSFGVWVGKPLHQTVQSFVQWRDQFAELADVEEARDLLGTGVYLLRPR